jgi:BCD family chlorophyll transporter-like MFS transporter
VFGAEVFAMQIAETSTFQRFWAGGVLIGMVMTGVVSYAFKIERKTLVILGLVGAAAAFLALSGSSLFESEPMVRPVLFAMGLFIGIFNVGALALMMEMTVANATGLYMGLWGTAQALGMGMSSLGSGALHTTLIGGGLLAPKHAYFGIFLLEAAGLMIAGYLLYRVSIRKFAARAGDTSKAGSSSTPLSAGTAARA